MKTYPLYQYNSYVKEVEAEVLDVSEKGVVFDKTIFYPGGGGQIHDTGYIVKRGVEYRVPRVFKEDEIYHVVEGVELEPGDKVLLKLDWERRYRIMKMHTSLHIIGAVMYKDYNVLITGSNIQEDRARIDFPMEEMNKEVAMEIVGKANSIALEG
ncbi:MAG TPA: alanyl-tRNA editing protein, partial [Thermoprotei archaeon]|nr:alanyl-tRNA editing protein [Thermoprotei archaeon]